MFVIRRFLHSFVFIFLCILLVGCLYKSDENVDPIDPQYYPTIDPTIASSSTPFQAVTDTPSAIPPSLTPTSTSTPNPTVTPSPTGTSTLTPESTTVSIPAGHVTAPILLYHHISDEGNGNIYYVSTENFRSQMEALRDWGYSSITVSQLVDVLNNGGELPVRPVVITFDDGNLDVYQNAFPIMRDLGFVGTFYVIAGKLQNNGYVDVEQLQEMADAGWELGSHSMTHTDLAADHSVAEFEIRLSMSTLEDATGDIVSTFAYPYGKTDDFITAMVGEYGYRAGMGLGLSADHTIDTLYYLSRIEIHWDFDLDTFSSLLPWSNN